MKTRTERKAQQMPYSSPAFPVTMAEATLAKQADTSGVAPKSKLTKRTYEECRSVGWDEARILEIESNGRYNIIFKHPLALSYTLLNVPSIMQQSIILIQNLIHTVVVMCMRYYIKLLKYI